MTHVALRSISLCAGIGGIDLGLAEWCRTVCYVERDAFCASVLVARMEEARLGCAPVWDNLATFDGRAWRGAVDLVVAGYPCQPFSVAGKQLGDQDERHLWPEVCRIIAECEAPLVFLENVAGHLSLGFGAVLSDLAALGFDAEWSLLRASDVGAPHRRERLFVLAHRNGTARLRECGVLDGERTALRNDADGRGADVADTNAALRHEPRRLDGAHGTDQTELGNAGLDVEHANSARRTPGNPGHALDAGSESLARCGPLGNSERPRLEERRSFAVTGSLTAAWPPGPSDRDGWERWTRDGGPQPVLRRGADEPAAFVDRADRLRALGNAVVPAQARAAFLELARRLP